MVRKRRLDVKKGRENCKEREDSIRRRQWRSGGEVGKRREGNK